MGVRSKYIERLMDKKNSLDEQYKQVVQESMKSIIGDNAKQEIRNLLKESDDEETFEKEDVADDEVLNTEKVGNEESIEGDDTENGLWDDLENCKSADGEYDCTGMDMEKVIDVINAMGPDDNVRIMANGDGTATVELDGEFANADETPEVIENGETEFVIDLNNGDGDNVDDVKDDITIDDNVDDENNDEQEFEIDLGESRDYDDNHGNTGYTSRYQKKTAMTTPDNHEPANPSTTYSMDAGVPKGTEKPWAHDGDKSPYSDTVNESDDTVFEVEVADGEQEIDETMTSAENNAYARNTGMVHQNTNNKGGKTKFRNGRTGENGQVKGTGENSYTGSTNESIELKKQINSLYRENKQMKSIIPGLQQKIEESMLINASMGYIVRLLNENATTRDEKIQISKRFGKVSSLNEAKGLYETISQELQSNKQDVNLNVVMNEQIAQGNQKKSLTEKTLYKSEGVNETLSFMQRLDKIK